ncbi:MAG TPA: glycosyltransferase family 9 protein [Anaeromyxobacteraceae bacterium]|nr:glycosyltransferase family 9 protein [Anaeromyxobacteraceae bacterium]
MARLSVTVVTLNEEASLLRLLDSVRGLADEVVVVDSGSTDRTVEIARAAGARVVSNPWPGFREQKAIALSQAAGDYVLNLDADERPDPTLARALRAELDRPGGPRAAGYRIHFRHRFAGRPVGFGQMWRDRRLRVVRRAGAAWTGSSVHPRLRVDGPVADLPGHCEHDGFRDAADASAKLARYAEGVARERFRAGQRWRPWDALRFPLGFVRRYLLWLGLLDGAAGFTLARLYARYDADKARWLRRLEREIGGARGRGAVASSLRAAGRRLVVALATLLFPTPRRPLPPQHAFRKLLVVRTDERVGNQLLTTPLLRALKLGIPHAELHLLAAARQSSVVASGHVDRVLPFEKRLFFRRPWRLAALLAALRRGRYDAVVEAGHWSGFSLTGSLLARVVAAGAPVVGHLRGESARFLSHAVPHDGANENEVRAKLELLRPFGLLPRGLEPETELGRDPALAARALAAAGVSGAYAVLNPGARMADRRWPPAAHAAVARGLAARGLPVLVVWGPGEEPIARAVADGGGARLAPATDLADLAALLRGARLCVSNNSGPMHLSVAVGAPTVGVFLSGDAVRWRHEVPWFEAAEPRGEGDAAAVLAACDRLLATAQNREASRPG